MCLRTDFDSFELPSQKATEYVLRGKIPSALQEARESVKGFTGFKESPLAVTLKDLQEYHGNLPGVRRELRKARQRSPDAKALKYLFRKNISLSYHFHWCLKSSFSHLVTCDVETAGSGAVLPSSGKDPRGNGPSPQRGEGLHPGWCPQKPCERKRCEKDDMR